MISSLSRYQGKLLHQCIGSSSNMARRWLSSGMSLHIRGLPVSLSENVAYPIFSSYGPLKELVVYKQTEYEKNAIVTFVKRPSAYACYDELHWRPLTVTNEMYHPEHYKKPSKDRNIVRIEYETKSSEERVPEWIQQERKVSQKRIPLYEQIYKLNQNMKQIMKKDNNEDEQIIQMESKLAELNHRLRETFDED